MKWDIVGVPVSSVAVTTSGKISIPQIAHIRGICDNTVFLRRCSKKEELGESRRRKIFEGSDGSVVKATMVVYSNDEVSAGSPAVEFVSSVNAVGTSPFNFNRIQNWSPCKRPSRYT